MILELRHLRIVDAIAKEGTVTAAAERIFLTQPAVSHALRELESRLGVQLFRRTGKRMEPTAEGRRVLEVADRVLDEVRTAELDLEHFKGGRRGRLRIATHCYTCYHWIPRVVEELGERLPEVELQIVPEATEDPTAFLLSERIDLAIMHRLPQHEEIAVEPLLEDEIVGILPPDHELAGRDWLEPRDFSNERIFLHGPRERSLLMSRYLAPAGVDPNRVSQLGLSEAIFECVRAGLGVSAMASWMAAAEVAAGKLAWARLAPDGLQRHWHAVALRKRIGKPAIVELIRLLRQQQETVAASVPRGAVAASS